MKPVARTVFGCLLLFGASVAFAQAWPTKPVKFYVAAAAGSAPDIIGRLVGDRLALVWGQQVVVENRPGAAGNLGVEVAARAPADGYSLLFGQAAPLAMNQYTFKSLGFDAEKDFVPVVGVGITPMLIAVNRAVPAKTLQELIALARAQPGRILFGTSSSKNVPHMAGELLKSMAGIDLVHVPYKSNGQAAQETVAGEIQIYIDAVPPIAGFLKDGRLRVLAVTSPTRLPNFPEIPAVAETVPGYQISGWFAIMAPTGTPGQIVARINADVNTVVKAPEVASRLLDFGVYDAGGTSEQLAEFIKADRGRLGRIVHEARIERE